MNHAAIENPAVHTERPDCFKEDIDNTVELLAKMRWRTPSILSEFLGDLSEEEYETLYQLMGKGLDDQENAAIIFFEYIRVLMRADVIAHAQSMMDAGRGNHVNG